MAPKGKKGKKAGDDWDEGLGESADPIAQADADAKAADAAADEEEETGGGGGLMAALKKNKEKRKKKGKNVGPDELEGEGDTVTPTVDESLDLAAKAPVEATMDDEDVFGGPAKKGKGGKGGKQQQQAKEADDGEEETGGVKTKAQKEKEKKEREKQRKKEQVCQMERSRIYLEHQLICIRRLLSRRSPLRLRHPQRKRTMPRQPLMQPLQPPQLHPKLLVVRRRSCLLVSRHSRSNKKSSASDKKKMSDSGKKSWLVLRKKRG